MEDEDLLRRYISERSESAFSELVRRNVNLVYTTALRQTGGDLHRAQEVTQMVFVTLARKAASLVRHPALPAWLYRSTSLIAADQRRKEMRRHIREQTAYLESELTSGSPAEFDWGQIRPALDAALNRLGERDREAIVLRYFACRPFADIGNKLGLSENAARMRVERALDKLRDSLNRRGITSTCAVIAAGLSAESVLGAPAGVATAATAAAMAAGISDGAGLLSFMITNKITVGAVGLLAAVAGLSVAGQVHARSQFAANAAEMELLARNDSILQSDHLALSRALGEAHDLQGSNQNEAAVSAKLASLRAENAALGRTLDARAEAAAIASGPIDNSKLDMQPRAVNRTRPGYPADMRARRLGGQVLVDYVVDANGNVQGAYAASSTQPEFEQAAVDAVSQWKYNPGRKSGAAATTEMQVPVVFSIGNESGAQQSTPGEPHPPALPSPSDWLPGDPHDVVVSAPFEIHAN